MRNNIIKIVTILLILVLLPTNIFADTGDDDRGYITLAEQADDDGLKQGEKEGGSKGQQDYEMARSMDSLRALNEFISEKSIESRYFLSSFPVEYQNAFKQAFIEAFYAHYNGAYAEYNMNVAEKNVNTKRVSMFEETHEFVEERYEYNSGTATTVTRTNGELFIPAGAIYKPTHIELARMERTFNQFNTKYIPTTSMYSISIINDENKIDLREPLTLKIPYYGSNRAAIYQLVDGKWRYLYSDQEVGFLKTIIPKGTYRGGQYAIFIDEEYKPIGDIKRHWAKEELYTFLRRGYIKGYEEKQGTLYYPNTTMKRAHFVELLGNVLGWDYEGLYDNSSRFKDSAHFGAYKDPINYAANMGYINGGTDGNFKPFDTITYQQVEWILRAVMRNQKLNWDVYETNIKNEKKTQTESLKSKTLPIKRGEVVYMLYQLQKENLI